MRRTVLAALTSLLVGFVAGVSLAPRTIVIHDRNLGASPLAPEMSLGRFLACSTAQAEPDMDALGAQWAKRYSRVAAPDWPAP